MKNRQIVLTRASIVAAVGFVVAFLALFGVDVDPALRDKIVNGLVLGLPVVLPLGAALWSRLHVTPTFDPRDSEGRPLVAHPEAVAEDHEGTNGEHRAS